MNMPLALLNRRRRIGGFSPNALFALAEPGVWFDPSDLTTLFQDTAGTTPVTTTGQSVGLMLDKSKGLVLGSELVTNGDFSAGASWTAGTGWTISGGVATKVAGTSANIDQSLALTAGRSYQVTYTITSISVAGAFIRLSGATTVDGVTRSTVGTFTEIVVAPASMTTLSLRAQSTTNVTVDNISVKELAGNHAVQATTANRPIYGVHPFGGRRNILLATDTLATQTRAVTAVSHTLSFTGTGTVTLSGVSTAGPLVGTGANDRVSLTFTPTAGNLTLTVSGSVTFAQLETGSTATAYQRVTDQYNVTEAGVSSVSYLFFDGVNDSMATSTITPGVDKAQVFAGVRKLSDAATAILVESSASVNSNAGAFYITAPEVTGVSGNYAWKSRGSVNPATPVSSGTLLAPNTSVLSGIGDISGDSATLRANGTQVGTSSADQGTGNFLAYPLYIGARAGTSLFFSGHLYGLIARFGPNLATGQISSTETWVAGKTGIVI